MPSRGEFVQLIFHASSIDAINQKDAMRSNKPNFNQLVVLDALLDECTVTKAARRLFLSQSATSSVMARRRHVSGPLSHKDSRSTVLRTAK
jgi:hypothetical protein